jgi:ABC-type lipoprotein release transport system permease subunit
LRRTLLAFVFLGVAIVFTIPPTSKAQQERVENIANYSLRVRFYDILTKAPLPNVPFSLNVNWTTYSGVSNGTGLFEFIWRGQNISDVGANALLYDISVRGNYSVIKVNEVFLETGSLATTTTYYNARYVKNQTSYSNLQVPLRVDVEKGSVRMELSVWLRRGKLVNVSTLVPSPATGGIGVFAWPKVVPYIRFGMPAEGFEGSQFEDLYFVPLYYETEVRFPAVFGTKSIRATFAENDTLLNLSHYVISDMANSIMNNINERLMWYDSNGLVVEGQRREFGNLMLIFHSCLEAFAKRDYRNGRSIFESAYQKARDLSRYIDDLDLYTNLTAVLIFSYSFLLAKFSVTLLLPEDELKRFLATILIFFISSFFFAFTQPFVRISSLNFLSVLTMGFAKVSTAPLSIAIASTFVYGSIFFFMLLGVSLLRPFPLFKMAVDIAVRNMRSRRLNAILVVVTISVITGTIVSYVNVTSSRGVVVVGSKPSPGWRAIVIEEPDRMSTIDAYMIDWLKDQRWCKQLVYTKDAPPMEEFYSLGFSLVGEGYTVPSVSVKGVDFSFLEARYNFSRIVSGSLPGPNERAILIPSTLQDIEVGDIVRLQLQRFSTLMGGPPSFTLLGFFKVKGVYDYSQAQKMLRPDGTPLFGADKGLVLIPNNIFSWDFAKVREVFVFATEGADVQRTSEWLASLTGKPVTASEGGIATTYEEITAFVLTGSWTHAILMAIACLIIYNTMAAMVMQRRRDFSTMATLGGNPSTLIAVFSIELLIYGAISVIAGVFGSYAINFASQLLANTLLGRGTFIPSSQWSFASMLVAMFAGLLMTFLGGFIPMINLQKLALMGRIVKKTVPTQSKDIGTSVLEYELPLRVPYSDSELLYNYLNEFLGMVVEGEGSSEVYQDGTFVFRFTLRSASDVGMECTIRSRREADVLYLSLRYPKVIEHLPQFQSMLYKIEKKLIEYPSWRETRTKLEIIRLPVSAVRRKTLEELISEATRLQARLEEISSRLQKLEEMRTKISATVFAEFKKKYSDEYNEIIRQLRPVAVELEPFRSELRDTVRNLTTQIERISASYNLGEIREEEYRERVEPLNRRLDEVKKDHDLIEEIFRQLSRRAVAL